MIYTTIAEFFDRLSEPYLQRSLGAIIFLGVLCSIIGIFIVLRGLVFMGQGIAHSAFAGGALGILLGINPFVPIFLFSGGMATAVGYINERGKLSNEIAVGIFFSFFMGLAILFISLMPVYSTDVNSLLFGNALTVSREDVTLLLVVGPIVLAVFFLIKRELLFITFDAELAQANGIRVRVLNYTFLLLTATTIVVSLRALGAILVMAMIVTPAAAAYQWTYNVNKMIVISVTFGVLSAFLGFMLSYLWDLASGPMVVGIATLCFVISFVISPKRRRSDYDPSKCVVCQRALSGAPVCSYCLDREEGKEIHEAFEGEESQETSPSPPAGGA